MEGFIKKSNLSSIRRRDNKQLRTRLIVDIGTDYYTVDTWLDKNGGIKVEVIKNTPQQTFSKVLSEGNVTELFE